MLSEVTISEKDKSDVANMWMIVYNEYMCIYKMVQMLVQYNIQKGDPERFELGGEVGQNFGKSTHDP